MDHILILCKWQFPDCCFFSQIDKNWNKALAKGIRSAISWNLPKSPQQNLIWKEQEGPWRLGYAISIPLLAQFPKCADKKIMLSIQARDIYQKGVIYLAIYLRASLTWKYRYKYAYIVFIHVL